MIIIQAVETNNIEVDYLELSLIFSTDTKIKDLDAPNGIEGLEKIKRGSNKPIICIGGINKKNIASIFPSGADETAVITANSKVKDSEQATKQLKEKICQTGTKK